jgi:hypothetical protein
VVVALDGGGASRASRGRGKCRKLKQPHDLLLSANKDKETILWLEKLGKVFERRNSRVCVSRELGADGRCKFAALGKFVA